MLRRPSRFTLGSALLAVAASLAIPLSAAAVEAPVSLTAPQVECNRSQLEALAERTSVRGLDGAPSQVVQSLLLTYSNQYGFYEGMVVGEPHYRPFVDPRSPGTVPGPEHELGFHLNPSVRELLLNPVRTPLEQVSMTREVSTSNLVPADDPFAVQVRLRPTLGASSAPAEGDLVIDNLAAPPGDGTAGFRIADTKPGRGLTTAGLTDLCHTRLTATDRRIFAILERTLRVDLGDAQSNVRFDTRITLFREQDPGAFGADVYFVDPDTGGLLDARLALSIEASVAPGKGLLNGLLVFEGLTGPDAQRVSGTVSIVRPVFGGVDESYEPVASIGYSAVLGWPVPPQVTFDWRDVLDGTEWSPAAPAAATCGHGTAAEIAATPRADENTELLALAMGTGVTADQAVYDRLVRDLGAIRALYPAVAGVQFFASYDARTLLLVPDGAATLAAIGQGTYHEWDCLNDWYGLQQVSLPPAIPPGSLGFAITLKGRYDLETVAADYADLSGIASASPAYYPLPAGPLPVPSLCAAVDGSTYRYFFDVIDGGPAETYYFTTAADGGVTFVGSAPAAAPAAPPPWYPLIGQCYDGLRMGYRG